MAFPYFQIVSIWDKFYYWTQQSGLDSLKVLTDRPLKIERFSPSFYPESTDEVSMDFVLSQTSSSTSCNVFTTSKASHHYPSTHYSLSDESGTPYERGFYSPQTNSS